MPTSYDTGTFMEINLNTKIKNTSSPFCIYFMCARKKPTYESLLMEISIVKLIVDFLSERTELQ